MKLQFKFDINVTSKKILQEHLDKLDLKYDIIGLGEVELKKEIRDDQLNELSDSLKTYGAEIVKDPKNAFVQKIKDLIVEMVYVDDLPTEKNSAYLVERLNHRYGYIANIFSEVTYTSIESFIILQKIERAKHLIVNDGLTLTEVAYRLNYSSVAHLSAQFKKITGLTPTLFQRILNKRRNLTED